MKKLILTAAIILSACSGDADDAAETEIEMKAATVPVIGDMQFTPETMYSYCSFQRKSQPFDYHDHSTWKFVFADESGDPTGKSYMMLDSEKRTLLPTFENVEGAIRVVHYETVEAPKVQVLLETAEGETAMEGILGIIKSKDGDTPTLYDESVIMIYGNCAV